MFIYCAGESLVDWKRSMVFNLFKKSNVSHLISILPLVVDRDRERGFLPWMDSAVFHLWLPSLPCATCSTVTAIVPFSLLPKTNKLIGFVSTNWTNVHVLFICCSVLRGAALTVLGLTAPELRNKPATGWNTIPQVKYWEVNVCMGPPVYMQSFLHWLYFI